MDFSPRILVLKHQIVVDESALRVVFLLSARFYKCLQLYILGVTDYLRAEISTSKQKKFSLVTFVDTPGLVDGDMVYPFDVNSAITSFGKSASLHFVQF